MKTISENRMEASTEVETYNKMMRTFQKVANRKDLKEHTHQNNFRFQREGSKLMSLLNVRSRTAKRSLPRRVSLLSKRNRCTKLVRST